MSATTNHLEGRTVIVTGAAGGFGRLLVEKAAALGANVCACDIDADALADLAGERIEIGTVDVTDLAAMRGLTGWSTFAPGPPPPPPGAPPGAPGARTDRRPGDPRH
ncbi:MAG: SDR family NAD(P)-dependent oxidoreductase [Candidatus Microthrix sp.]|nr:SDR family NAD(P)-dependent oxidoreductase [Candidatus Microthrix sp.]MBK9559880.1 SDR family NAD(P)-dependent oxidoreductase [Candidatus Microthrix sp.]